MSYNDLLRQKLKINIYGVLFFLTISAITVGIRIYQLYFQEMPLIEINGRLLTNDYLIFILFGWGILGLIASILIRTYFDNFYPKDQVALFSGLGILFMPYTVILFVLGIMKYLEKNKFKKNFFGSIFIAIIALGLIFNITIGQLNKIDGLYLNQYIYEFYYDYDDNNYATFTLTATSRGNELQTVTVDAYLTFEAPEVQNEEVTSFMYNIKTNYKWLCPEGIALQMEGETLDNYHATCTITDAAAKGLYKSDIDQKSDIDLHIMFTDIYMALGDESVNVIFTRSEYITNVYE